MLFCILCCCCSTAGISAWFQPADLFSEFLCNTYDLRTVNNAVQQGNPKPLPAGKERMVFCQAAEKHVHWWRSVCGQTEPISSSSSPFDNICFTNGSFQTTKHEHRQWGDLHTEKSVSQQQ